MLEALQLRAKSGELSNEDTKATFDRNLQKPSDCPTPAKKSAARTHSKPTKRSA